MKSIETFFVEKAASFSDGRMMEASASHTLPTTIYIGDQILFVRDLEHLSDVLSACHARLKDQGYARTLCEVTSKTALAREGTRANVRWIHLDQAERTLRHVDMSYYCKLKDESWTIDMVEVTPQSDLVDLAPAL